METRRKGIQELCPDTQALMDYVRSFKAGCEISYEDLAKACGRTVLQMKPLLQGSARGIMLRDHGVFFVTLRGQGIRIVSGAEAPRILGACERRRIHMAARRTARRIAQAVQGMELDNDQKIELGYALSMLGAIRLCTESKSRDRLFGAVVANENRMLPVGQVLSLFAKTDSAPDGRHVT